MPIVPPRSNDALTWVCPKCGRVTTISGGSTPLIPVPECCGVEGEIEETLGPSTQDSVREMLDSKYPSTRRAERMEVASRVLAGMLSGAQTLDAEDSPNPALDSWLFQDAVCWADKLIAEVDK